MNRAEWEAQQPLVPDEKQFNRAIRLNREWKALQEQQRTVFADQWAEFIPDLGPTEAGPRSDYQQAVNEAIESITGDEVFEACQRAGLIRATQKPVRAWGRDSNKFSCANPNHPDDHFSAWGWENGDHNKGVWNCGRCGGGDKMTLLGYLYGLQTKGSDFHQLCNRAAAEFRGVMEPTPEPSPTMPTPPVVVVVDEPTGPGGTSGHTNQSSPDYDEPEAGFPSYNLSAVLPGTDTFLDFYCGEALKSDIPREFPLWVGLSILSVAIGRRVSLRMIEIPTYANLAVCLTANSASGKGRSSRQGVALLREAVPYDDTPLMSAMAPTGARVMRLPGSGEALVDELDEVSGALHFSSPALVEFEEIQMLLSKSAGPNSAYKDYIIEFADSLDIVTRSSLKNGKARVEKGFVTFLTATQPKRLRDQFTKSDEGRGLLNRFIFPFGRAVPMRIWDAPELNWMASNLMLRSVWNWADGGPYVIEKSDWDDEARDMWIHEEAARLIPDKMGEQSDLLGRLDVHMMRLILLFAANEKSEKVHVGHVRSAFALYDYIKACALNLARQIAATAMSDSMTLVLEAVVKAEEKLRKPPTERELKKTSAAINKMNPEEFANVIEKLVRVRQIYYVRTASKTGKGRSGLGYTRDLHQWDTSSTVAVSVTSKP